MILGSAALATSAQAQSDQRQHDVETGLRPVVVFDGVAPSWTIQDRMARWQTPGVSIAVIEGGKIAWAQGYGVLRSGEDAPVTTQTRFQAASISKPVAAVVALSLVQDGTLSLEGDINDMLVSWRLPTSRWTQANPVNLSQLLSHTAGVTVHGFAGYARDGEIPTLVQILSGEPPANSPPVISESEPGTGWKYSGGGYEIVQLLIEDVTDRPFASVVQDRLLTAAHMTESGYDEPSPAQAASGHGRDGTPLDGGWRTYPEQAAAGLWTTPGDLARFGLALSGSLSGRDGAVLGQDMARQMMTPVLDDYGLGPGISGAGETLALSHGGSNAGYQAFWIIHPNTGDGAVVMTNGDGGDRLMMEIIRAVAKVYNWPDQASIQRSRFPLSSEILASRQGDWVTEIDGDTITFIVSLQGEDLVIATPRGSYAFTPVSSSGMQSSEAGATAEFTTSADGVSQLDIYGLQLYRQPAPPSGN